MKSKELTFSIAATIDNKPAAYLIHRRDDGEWKLYKDTSDTKDELIDDIQSCGNRLVILSKESKSFIVSRNNGKHFTEIPYTEEMLEHPVTSIIMLDANDILACAKDGYIFKSCDSGFLWYPVQTGKVTTHDYNVIECCAKDKRIVCTAGNCGTVSLSTNHGETFKLIYTSFIDDITSVYIYDERYIVVGCKGGTAYETYNCGNAWVEITPPADMLLGDNCVIEDIFSWYG